MKSLFLEVFGDSPVLRVMDFFMVSEDFDYSMSDIARNAGIGYSTIKLFWKNLVKNNIVTHTRNVGKAKLYALNKESEAVKNFKKFYWSVTKDETDKRIIKVLSPQAP